MTVCKTLADMKLPNGYTVTATESIDKYSTRSRYDVSVSRDGLALFEYPCARTTWKKRFNEVVLWWENRA